MSRVHFSLRLMMGLLGREPARGGGASASSGISQGCSRLLPELPELARASPDSWAFSVPGACGCCLLGAPLSAALAELSRELLLELGAVVSRCCCSSPGAPWP